MIRIKNLYYYYLIVWQKSQRLRFRIQSLKHCRQRFNLIHNENYSLWDYFLHDLSARHPRGYCLAVYALYACGVKPKRTTASVFKREA